MIFHFIRWKGAAIHSLETISIPSELDDLAEEVEAWLLSVQPTHFRGLRKVPFLRAREYEMRVGINTTLTHWYPVGIFFLLDNVSHSLRLIAKGGEEPREIDPAFWEQLPERLFRYLAAEYRRMGEDNQDVDLFIAEGNRRWPLPPPEPEGPEPVSRFERDALL